MNLNIPTKSVIEKFEWPLRFCPGTSDSDISTAIPPASWQSEQDVRDDIAETLRNLKGPSLVAACEAVHCLLVFQAVPRDDS